MRYQIKRRDPTTPSRDGDWRLENCIINAIIIFWRRYLIYLRSKYRIEANDTDSEYHFMNFWADSKATATPPAGYCVVIDVAFFQILAAFI